METANEALHEIRLWMRKGLKIAEHETKAVILKVGRKKENIAFKLGDTTIGHQKLIK